MKEATFVRKNPVPAQPPIVSIELDALTPVQASKLFSVLSAIGDSDLDEIYFSLLDEMEAVRGQVGRFMVVRFNEDDEEETLSGSVLNLRTENV